MKYLVTTTLTCFIIVLHAYSQKSEVVSDTLRAHALNVYMPASDHIKREIPYINYVRDRKDADVYIITTSQNTGSGGSKYTYYITGQYEFSGMTDTITFESNPDETTAMIREKQVSTLKMSLMRYVARTPLSQYIDINFNQLLSETVVTDKWDSWIFRINIEGNLRKSGNVSETAANGNLNINRTTSALKFNLNLDYYYEKNIYDYGFDIIKSKNKIKSLDGIIVKSISDHISIGGVFAIGASTFANEALAIVAMPAIEFDLFPYSQSDRRQFRFLYKAGYRYLKYEETTIFGETKDKYWLHILTGDFEMIEKWGAAYFDLSYSNPFDDWSNNSLSFGAAANIRVFKGLFFTVSGRAIYYQESLFDEWNYDTSFGLSYTFGSIYNNVVNPRFGYYRNDIY